MAYDLEKEKREAINAGHKALQSLRSAQKHLDSARGWGMFDMFGGGTISTILKHSKMDKAKRDMEQAKYDLQSFARELNDVNINGSLNLETYDFLAFADVFFDGFLVDWMMQDRINKARKQVADAIRQVERILRKLERY